MAEYIAKKLAIELMHQSSYLSDGDLLEVNGNLAKARIEAEPAADVVPVVHGKWIKVGVWGRVYRCSQCGNFLDFDAVNAGRGDANFCPNCGADMRGEQDG